MMTFAPGAEDHLSETTVAEYLDNRLPAAERDRVEAHLADCKACRDEVLGARQFLQRRLRSRRLIAGGGLIAVAAALVLMVQMPRITPTSDTRDPMRAGGTESPVVAYGPIGEVSSRALQFIWGATPNVTTYRITVSTGNGRAVWSRSTSDTAVTLPDSVTLLRDQPYYWVVDALLGDGATRTTGLREFRIAQ
jgi:hypothetical protein